MSFAAACVVGVAVGNSSTTILTRAVVVMVLAWFVGRVIGGIAQKTIEDHLNSYKRNHPIPDSSGAAAPGIEGDGAANGAA